MINILTKSLLTQADVINLGDQYGFGHISTFGQGLGYLINPAFAIAGIAVLFYLIMGAFKLLTSSGDKATVDSARNMITHAIIGVILLMAMFLILKFIPEFFGLKGLEFIK